MEIHQKTLFEKRSFFLLDNKLKLYLKNPEGEYENYISYENLKNEVKIYCRKIPQLFYLTLAISSFAVCSFLYSIFTDEDFTYTYTSAVAIAIIIGVLYRIKQQNYIIIETFDSKKIIFLKDKPSREVLHLFLKRLWQQRKLYLREKYFYINPSNDLQQEIERLRWLLEQNVITKKEFQLAKEDWIIERDIG